MIRTLSPLLRPLTLTLGLSSLLLGCAPQESTADTASTVTAAEAVSTSSAAAASEPTTSAEAATGSAAASGALSTEPRVIALEYSYLDMLAALGLQAAGATLGNTGAERGAPAYLEPYLDGVTDVGTRAQPSLETISTLSPDLILADSKTHAEVLPGLKELGQVQEFDNRSASYDDVMEQLQAVAGLTGCEAQAQAELDRQKVLLADMQAAAAQDAPAILAAVATPEGVWVHSDESFAGSLFEKVGRQNVAQAQGGKVIYEVSLEGLAALNPPSLLLMTGTDETPITADWASNPLWQKLDAVQQGKVYEVDRDLWTRSRGPLAVGLILEQMRDSGLLHNEAPAEGFQPRL